MALDMVETKRSPSEDKVVSKDVVDMKEHNEDWFCLTATDWTKSFIPDNISEQNGRTSSTLLIGLSNLRHSDII